jgi:hypothetical protein
MYSLQSIVEASYNSYYCKLCVACSSYMLHGIRYKQRWADIEDSRHMYSLSLTALDNNNNNNDQFLYSNVLDLRKLNVYNTYVCCLSFS